MESIPEPPTRVEGTFRLEGKGRRGHPTRPAPIVYGGYVRGLLRGEWVRGQRRPPANALILEQDDGRCLLVEIETIALKCAQSRAWLEAHRVDGALRIALYGLERCGSFEEAQVALGALDALHGHGKRGRIRLEADRSSSWWEIAEEAEALKRQNPRLPWSVIAQNHCNVAPSTLSKYRAKRRRALAGESQSAGRARKKRS